MKDIGQLLEQTGIPVAEGRFTVPQNPPFILYFAEKRHHRGADNKNMLVQSDYRIELYTNTNDTTSENAVDGVLAEFEHEKSSAYIAEDWMNEIIYTFTTLEKFRRKQ